MHAFHDALREKRSNEYEQEEVEQGRSIVAIVAYDENDGGSEEKDETVDDNRIARHRFFPQSGIGSSHLIVGHDTFMEVLERVDGLLEYLDDRYAPDIFYGFRIHFFQ